MAVARWLTSLLFLLPLRAAEPLTLCQALAQPDLADGRELVLQGAYTSGMHGSHLSSEECGPALVRNGRAWPWGVALEHGGGFRWPKLPPKKLHQEIVLTLRGRLRIPRLEGRWVGAGHLNWAPAGFVPTELLDITVVEHTVYSVCDVLAGRTPKSGAPLWIRGQLAPANSGYFLKAHGCDTPLAEPVIWIAGYGAPKLLQQPGPDWRRTLSRLIPREPVSLLTILGRLEFAAPGSSGFGPEGAFPVQLIRVRERDLTSADDK